MMTKALGQRSKSSKKDGKRLILEALLLSAAKYQSLTAPKWV